MYNILYLTGSVNLWGARRSLFDLLQNIDRKKFSISVVCGKEGPLTEKLEKEKIDYTIIPLPLWRKGKNLPRIPFSLFPLAKLVRKKNIHLIHCNSHWVNPYGVIAGKLTNVKVICHVRDIITPDKIKKYFINYSDRIVTISNFQKKVFNRYPVLNKRTHLVYNGIDTSRFYRRKENEISKFRNKWNIEEDDFLVGCVGQISSLKGQEYLVRAIPMVLKEIPNTKFLLCGQVRRERDEGKIESLTEKLGIKKNVISLGWQEDLPIVYSSLDILAFPTLKEAFGRVAVEAMACKVPVIATKIGGIPEIVEEGKTGFLIPPKNPIQIADAVKRLLKDSKMRKNMGAEGRKKVKEKFSIKDTVHKIENLYYSLLS
jgi:glycosyltransferase involved in cell wall biosynthesis